MYGGLFGDLPSTKKAQSGDDDKESSAAVDAGAPPPSNQAQQNEAKQQQETPNKKRPASVVEKLGAAGTTMAFVPAALRNRKRVNSAVAAPATAKPKPPPQPSHTTKSTAENESNVSHIHQNDDPSFDNNNATMIEEEEESEAMMQLHASVVDIYDPHVPNDLLAYWDRKAMERERLELEREAKETLARQERLRQQLEQERASLEKSGNLDKLVEHRQQTTMGRGRGISNLPAWLVEKQKEKVGSGGDIHTGSVVEKKPQCTVILSNLTAPGDIDEDLAAEVKEECEELCGPVASIDIKDARPPHQPVVQVHVEFRTRGDAEKAVRIFHGRKFGQRRITAEFI